MMKESGTKSKIKQYFVKFMDRVVKYRDHFHLQVMTIGK